MADFFTDKELNRMDEMAHQVMDLVREMHEFYWTKSQELAKKEYSAGGMHRQMADAEHVGKVAAAHRKLMKAKTALDDIRHFDVRFK